MNTSQITAGFALPSRSSSAATTNNNRNGASKKDGATGGSRRNETNSRKRPLSAFHSHEDDSEQSGSDSDAGHHSRVSTGGRNRGHQAISGFDNGGAVAASSETGRKKEKDVLVIPRLKNADWRGELKRKRGGDSLLPEEERRRRQAQQAAGSNGQRTEAEGVDVVNGEKSTPTWGLSITKKPMGEDGPVKNDSAASRENKDLSSSSENQKDGTPEPPKTDDQLALEALTGTGGASRKGPDLVITSSSSTTTNGLRAPADRDGDAYRRALEAAPDVSTLEDYERVPVEEFGAALLRGMGWDGKVSKQKEVKRRQNLLGLGATALKEAEELGAWNHRAGKPGGKERKKNLNDYRREKERKEERRDERYGGSYKRERERDDSYNRRDRDRDGYRDRDRDRERYRR